MRQYLVDQGRGAYICEVDGYRGAVPVLHSLPSVQWGQGEVLADNRRWNTTKGLCPKAHHSDRVQEHSESGYLRPDVWHKHSQSEKQEIVFHRFPASG